MKVTVAHADLARALKIAGKSCSRRPTLPVLAGARLEVKAGLLEITTTDLELSSHTELEPPYASDTVIDGAVIVPLAELAGALKGHQPKGATVTLEHDQEANVLRVRVGAMNLALRLLDADDYPTLQSFDYVASDQLVTSDLDQIRAWAERVLPATSDDDMRPVLTAVLVQRDHDKLTAAATDSYRLHTYSTDSPGTAFSFLLPGPALRFAHDTMKAHKATSAAMWYRATPYPAYARMQIGPTTIVTRAVEGTFPDFEHLMPKVDGAPAIDIKNAQAAAAALKTIPTSAERTNTPVVLESSGRAILGTVNVQDMSKLELEIPGLDMGEDGPFDAMGFKPKYLRELIAANGNGTLRLLSPAKPAYIANGNGFRGLLVPVRIAG